MADGCDDTGDEDVLDSPPHENSPKHIILPTEDIVQAFHVRTGNQVMNADLKEIITEILTIFLNHKIDNIQALNSLPQIDRMKDRRFVTDAVFNEQVKSATIEMGYALHNRLVQLGVYHLGTFSYFYDDLLGSDLLLSYFPF